MKQAEFIAIPLSCLCELTWVLRSVYNLDRDAIAAAIFALVHASNVAMNRPAVEAGLAVQNEGGDFADGVIAHEGRFLGGEVFASMDKRAASLIERQGYKTHLVK